MPYNHFPKPHQDLIPYAMKVYLELLSNRPNLNSLSSINMFFSGNSINLRDIDPICYSCYVETGKRISSDEKAQAFRLLKKIYPQFSEYFKMIHRK